MTINYSNTDVAGNLGYIWPAMATGDDGKPALHSGTGDRTVQVFGTFGAGGSVTLEGSLDGEHWTAMHDTQGVSISLTSPGMRVVLENAVYIRPVVSGGDGSTAITTILNVRR